MKTNSQWICTPYLLLALFISVSQSFADGMPSPDEITLTMIRNDPANLMRDHEIPENPGTNIALKRVERPEKPEAPEVPETPTTPEVPETPTTPEVPETPVTPEPPPPPATPPPPRRPRCVPRRRSR